MKKKIRKFIIISVLTILVIGIILNYYLGFSDTLNLMRTISSIGIFLTAIIAFDQFGLKRSRKIKEVELAREFYEKMQNVCVQGHTLNEEPILGKIEVTLMIWPYHGLDHFRTTYLKNKYAFYTLNYDKYFNQEISNIVTNIFFPKELYERFKFIEHDISQVSLKSKEHWDLDKGIFLATGKTDFDKTGVMNPIGAPQLKFQHVLNNYDKIISETEKYLEENGYTINQTKKAHNTR